MPEETTKKETTEKYMWLTWPEVNRIVSAIVEAHREAVEQTRKIGHVLVIVSEPDETMAAAARKLGWNEEPFFDLDPVKLPAFAEPIVPGANPRRLAEWFEGLKLEGKHTIVFARSGMFWPSPEGNWQSEWSPREPWKLL